MSSKELGGTAGDSLPLVALSDMPNLVEFCITVPDLLVYPPLELLESQQGEEPGLDAMVDLPHAIISLHLPFIPALCSLLETTGYSENYARIIPTSLALSWG